jgi:hypothetical protein
MHEACSGKRRKSTHSFCPGQCGSLDLQRIVEKSLKFNRRLLCAPAGSCSRDTGSEPLRKVARHQGALRNPVIFFKAEPCFFGVPVCHQCLPY